MSFFTVLGLIALGAIVSLIIMSCISSNGYVDKLQEAYDLGYKKGLVDGNGKDNE